MSDIYKATIFCLPYAGGTASIYANWEKYLPLGIKLVALELPGHGSRSSEPLLSDIKQLIEDLFHRIETQLIGNYYLLGCSMGALLSYELAKRIRESLHPMPIGLIIAAQKAPSISSPPPYLCEQPPVKLKAFLHNLGGLPEAVLNSELLLDYFLPLIRADLSLVEKYKYEVCEPLSSSIFAFYSPEDTLYRKSAVEIWQHFTSSHFALCKVRGGHLFIKSHTQEFISQLLLYILPQKNNPKTCHTIITTLEKL